MKNTSQVIFLDQLKLLCKKNGISINRFCSDVDITPTAISNYRGKRRLPSLTVLIKTANYFNITLDYLVYGKSNKIQNPELEQAILKLQTLSKAKLDPIIHSLESLCEFYNL